MTGSQNCHCEKSACGGRRSNLETWETRLLRTPMPHPPLAGSLRCGTQFPKMSQPPGNMAILISLVLLYNFSGLFVPFNAFQQLFIVANCLLFRPYAGLENSLFTHQPG